MSQEVARTVLGPCTRPGKKGDWWEEQHTQCTGTHSLDSGHHVTCTCECHQVATIATIAKIASDVFVKPAAPAVNKPVLVCVNDGDNVYFMVAHRTHKDVFQSFVYYSPQHGEEFPLDNVVDWHPLP